MAPSHNSKQCWLIFSEVLWYSSEAILQDMLKISILDLSLKIINVILQLYLPGANELICVDLNGIHEYHKFNWFADNHKTSFRPTLLDLHFIEDHIGSFTGIVSVYHGNVDQQIIKYPV